MLGIIMETVEIYTNDQSHVSLMLRRYYCTAVEIKREFLDQPTRAAFVQCILFVLDA